MVNVQVNIQIENSMTFDIYYCFFLLFIVSIHFDVHHGFPNISFTSMWISTHGETLRRVQFSSTTASRFKDIGPQTPKKIKARKDALSFFFLVLNHVNIWLIMGGIWLIYG